MIGFKSLWSIYFQILFIFLIIYLGTPSLIYAAINGQTDVVKSLLNQGADVNLKTDSGKIYDIVNNLSFYDIYFK